MNMKTSFFTQATLTFSVIFMTAALSACENIQPHADEEMSTEELEIAAHMIGSSLSDMEGGLISSLYDAVSDIDEQGISYDRPWNRMEWNDAAQSRDEHNGDQDRRDERNREDDRNRDGDRDEDHRGHGDGNRYDEDRSRENNNGDDRNPREREEERGRGTESHYEVYYNPETGEHVTKFIREFEGPNVSRSLKVRSIYIFSDANGDFLEFPRRQREQIETIDFKGTREGTTTGPVRFNRFYRFDQFVLRGVSPRSPVLQLMGSHQGNGEMNVKMERRDMAAERAFRVYFDFEDIRIDKEAVRENGNLEDGITGFITYRMHMSRTVNGEKNENTLSGVIELTGDGSALLRFDKLQQMFRIALVTGNVTRPPNGDNGDRSNTRF